MLHAISERALPYRGDLVNLEDLRRQLASRLALLVIGASSLAMVVFLLQEPFPIVAFGLLAALFGLGWIIRVQVKVHPNLASHLLIWGLTASQVVAYRPDGLQPAEVLQCLRAMIETLKPRYDERSVPKEILTQR